MSAPAAPAEPARAQSSPYRGLTPYGEADADRFFGRDSEREKIISNLMARRLTLLYGESGVGKSSVLYAGVAHHLRLRARAEMAEFEAARAVPVTFSSWRDDPISAFARSLHDQTAEFVPRDADVPEPDADAPLDQLVAGFSARLGAKLVLILDQFEEYFVYHEHESGDDTFAAQFPRLVLDPTIRCNVLIAMREDTLARLDRFKGVIPNLMQHRLRIRHLDQRSARAAIEKPLEGTGVRAEAELVSAVLQQVEAGKIGLTDTGLGDASGGSASNGDGRIEAPYLQLVMTRLWNEEMEAGSDVLRAETLERIGGAETIVRTHLDGALATLDEHQQDVAGEVFKYLVTRSGTKIAYTVADLSYYTGCAGDEVRTVLERLSDRDTRVVRPVSSPDGREDGVRYEVFHDVLGPAVLDWRSRHAQEVEKAHLAEELERKAEQTREAERIAEHERRRAWRSRIAVVVLLVLLIGGATGVAIWQMNLAADRKDESESTAVGLQASLTGLPDLGMLAGLEAYRLSPTFDARSAVLTQLQVNAGLPRVLLGHSRWVNALAFSPDGDVLASGSSDQAVRLWDVKTGRPLGEPLLQVHALVRAVAFSPDGKTLVAAGDAYEIQRWDVSNPAHPRELDSLFGGEHNTALAFSRDGRLLASGDDSGSVWVWNRDGELLDIPAGKVPHTGAINALAFGSGDLLASASSDGRVALWDTSKPKHVVQTLSNLPRKGSSAVNAVAFTPAGGRLAIGDAGGTTDDPDGEIEIYDLHGPRRATLEHVVVAHTDDVVSLAFADGGSTLVSGSLDLAVKFWDLTAPDIATFGPPRTIEQGVGAVAVNEDGIVAAGGSLDGFIKLWPLHESEALAVSLPDDSIGNLDVALHGNAVTVASGTDGVSTWDVGDYHLGAPLLTPDKATAPSGNPLKTKGWNAAVATSGDLMALGEGKRFSLWDTTNSTQPHRIAKSALLHNEAIADIAFAPGGKLLATASEDDSAMLWDVSDPEHISRLGSAIRAHDGDLTKVEFSRVGQMLATASDDGDVRLWNIRDPAHPREIGKPLDTGGFEVYAIAFSPDGTKLASGGGDQRIILWDITDPQRPLPLRLGKQSNSIFALAFSPDGKLLAAGDGDGEIVLWDVELRRRLGGDLFTHDELENTSSMDALVFDPKGRFLISSGRREPTTIWSSALWADDYETLRRYACRVAGRNLTREEWDASFQETKLAGDRHRTCPEWPLDG